MFMAVLSITVPILDPILVWMIVSHPNSALFHRTAAVGLLFLNFYWYTLFFSKWVQEYKTMKVKKNTAPEVKVKSMYTLIYILKFSKKMQEVKERMGQERQMSPFSSIRAYSECDSYYYEEDASGLKKKQ